MPLGGYAIEAHGLDELKEGLRGSRGGLRDLRRAYAHIAETAGHHVRARAPIGSASAKDGAGHLPPGYLKASVRWGATINGPWVSAGADPEFPLTLQEFGGTSFWHRGGRGAIRAANRGHAAITSLGISKGAGHVVYKKPRNPLGYFIWNVGYRLRGPIGEQLHFGIGQVCRMHDLPYEMPASPALELTPQAWNGR